MPMRRHAAFCRLPCPIKSEGQVPRQTGSRAMPEQTILTYAALNTPRYTSYPTAPHFHAGVDGDTYAEWLGTLTSDLSGSLYLHIPYCRQLCWYCGCSTRATTRPEPVDAYVDTLLEEIALTAARMPGRPRIGHIHFGGGTPSLVRAPKMAAIMFALRAQFDVATDAEIAIEIDPRHCSQTLVTQLAALGFNRASLGIQTFDTRVQKKINRVQSIEDVATCVSELRGAGIDRISFDLLYGLPGQTAESCRETVHAALALRPDRLSVFGYAHVPHMRAHQKLIEERDLPGQTERIKQAVAIAETLEGEGYIAIGIDHYARPDDDMVRQLESGALKRNFQGYTTDQADFLLGFGASSIGKLPQGYVQNTPSVADWAKKVKAGAFATARGVALSEDDRLRGDIIEKLMCDLHVDRASIERRHGATFPQAEMSDLMERGIVREEAGRLEIPDQYRMLARVVAARFDAHLANAPGAKHSRSI